MTQPTSSATNPKDITNELQLLYDDAPCGYHSLDAEGRVVKVNNTELKMLGYTREEMIGQKITKFSTEASIQIFKANFPKIKQGMRFYDVEIELICKDGSILPVSVTVTPIIDESGKFVMTHSIIIDISERKRLEKERQKAQKALIESEQKLQAFLDHAPAVIFMSDQSNNHLLFNRHYTKLVGMSREQLLGKNIYDVWTKELADSFIADNRQVIESNQILETEEIVPQADGLHTYLTLKFPLYDSENNVYAVGGIATDITERKKSEQAIIASEQKLQAILDYAPAIIYLVDLENRCLLANRLCAEVTNSTSEQLLGKNIYNFLNKEIADVCATNNRQVVETKQIIEIEEIVPLADGLHTYITLKFPLCDQEGNVYAVGGISTDITERKEAQQKIAQQAALIDITNDAIIVRGLDQHILFWNQGAERLYGWQAEEVLGQTSSEILYKNSDILNQVIATTLKEGFWQGELEQLTKTGSEIIVASRWTLVDNNFNTSQSFLIVNTDITEKKQLEKQFYQAQRLESLGTLASGIAHDLNNIFTPILMIAQLIPLRLKDLDEPTLQLLKILEDNVQRGSQLVRQVLTFARGQKGQHLPLNIRDLIAEVLTIANNTFPKFINISSNIFSDTNCLISADATQLHQVIMNLVINARDAMPEGGKLRITAYNRVIDKTYAKMCPNATPGNYVVITVKDTGIGIAPEIIDRIFDPFFTTKEVGKGTGLGLSTVIGIVKNHGGFVKVSSDRPKGTEFQIYLPVIAENTEIITTETEFIRGNDELILVVDDDPIVRQIAQFSLENYNYQVIIAEDGINAIALYAEHKQKIKLVLMDLMMPKMDGLTAIRTLLVMNPKINIIANSGLLTQRKEALDAGAKIFLAKPYTTQELLQAISQIIK